MCISIYKDMDKKLLLLFALCVGILPALFSYVIVFGFAMMVLGFDYTVEVMTQGWFLGVLGVWAAWRTHVAYDRIKKIIIETTDRFNDIIRKYKEQVMKDKFGH